MRKRRRRLRLLVALGVLAGGGFAAWSWMAQRLAPMPERGALYVRFWKATAAKPALLWLQVHGVVRDAGAMRLYFYLRRGPNELPVGTYLVQPGDSAEQVVEALKSPIRQMVRMPETNWARRDANLLQRAQVTSAHDYLVEVGEPAAFKDDVTFPIPSKSLEGYLLPDTYDFPPLLGAKEVVQRRLHAFETKVWERVGKPRDLSRIVTLASLVELEAGRDADRPLIAGVIQNRLKKKMPLQIDASLEYALGKWRRLHFKDYRDIKSPYNLYLHKGLPPTPICSPSLKSVEAAMHPAKCDYLFYVALPNGESLFSKTFAEHQKKIKLRLKALKAEGALTLPSSARGEGSRKGH